jgi:hypothetical protein
MAATIRQLESQACRAGKRGERWQNVLDGLAGDIAVLAGHNRAKRRRFERLLIGAALAGGNENKAGDWWADDREGQDEPSASGRNP